MDYNKLNLIVRIVLIILLILIAGIMIKNKVGQDCDYDIQVTNRVNGEVHTPEVILDYYFENKLGQDLYKDVGSFGLLNISG